MKTLKQLEQEHIENGHYFPAHGEMVGYLTRLEEEIERIFEAYDVNLEGVKGNTIKAVRLDIAGEIIRRYVTTFGDLATHELEYIESFTQTFGIEELMQTLGWIPEPSYDCILFTCRALNLTDRQQANLMGKLGNHDN